MKSDYLFPPVFKKIGWAVFIPFAILGVWQLLNPDGTTIEWLNGKAFAIYSPPFFGPAVWFGWEENNWIDEITVIMLAVSMLLLAFSREKDEDEYIAHLRLKSIVWAIKGNVALLIGATLFIFGYAYANFAWIYMFSMFMLYLIKFNHSLYKFRRSSHEE